MKYITLFASDTHPFFVKCPICKYRTLFTPMPNVRRPYKTSMKCWHCRQAYMSVTFVDSKG